MFVFFFTCKDTTQLLSYQLFSCKNHEEHRGGASRQGARSPRERISNDLTSSLAPANIVTFKKYVEHYLWAGTRSAPAVVGLGKKLIVIMRNLNNFIQACGLGKKVIVIMRTLINFIQACVLGKKSMVIMRTLNNFIQAVGLGKKLIVIMLSSKNFSCRLT